jgi:hypothetical protein
MSWKKSLNLERERERGREGERERERGPYMSWAKSLQNIAAVPLLFSLIHPWAS